MKRLGFYSQYAIRNIWRNRRWSVFAMLSIAAGVATVVALRSLGLAIGDSLVNNVRSANHGDINVVRYSDRLTFGTTGYGDVFRTEEIEKVYRWVEQNNATVSVYTQTNMQLTAIDRQAGLLNLVTALLIDPATYPLTQDIYALEPKGVPLGQLFTGVGNEVVIGDNLALAQDLQIGDQVRVSGTEETFIVRGIVPTEAEAGLRNMIASFFGFAYFDRSRASLLLSVHENPNGFNINLPDGSSDAEIIEAGRDMRDLVRYRRIRTVPRLIEVNQIIADLVGRFIVVMGLGAMLIGGVGIINTMLVLVRRRTMEVAALKTFGLKGRQVAILFMIEALIMGLIGSLFGSLLGAFLSRLTNVYGETFINQPLTWQIYPEAILFGVVLGMVVTVVFGVLPILTAVKVRPAIILRPNEFHIPALGLLQSFGVLIFMTIALGLIAGQIVGPFPEQIDRLENLPIGSHLAAGVIGVAITLSILGILVCLLWGLVWLISKLPTFGWLNMRLALKNVSTNRIRTATTLLAISVGMFAISSITFYGAGVREILQVTLSEAYGGNILIISPDSFISSRTLSALTGDQLPDKIAELGDKVQYTSNFAGYYERVAQVDELSVRNVDLGPTRNQLEDERERALTEGDLALAQELEEQIDLLTTSVMISVQDSTNPNLKSGDISDGRSLTPADYGQRVAVVVIDARMEMWGVGLGSMLTLDLDDEEQVYEVVGLITPNEFGFTFTIGDVILPGGTFDHIQPEYKITTLEVPDEHLDDVMLEISSLPFTFPFNVEFIDSIVGRFIDQFSALPMLVGILSLGAAGVIMANTVALATLERRRQIGILKAIGLKSKRILSIMLLENIVISLLGAVLGLGLSALGVVAMTYFGLKELVVVPDDARPVAFILVGVAVLIGIIATLLSAQSAVRERVLNVLRYE